MTRREATRLIAGGAAGLLVAPTLAAEETTRMIRSPIPSSGEMLPVIGLGTAGPFDIGSSATERQLLDEVMALFAKSGAKLIDRVRGKALPDWAVEFDCKSWGQFFLKWIIAHPVVTCAIPATGNPHHMEDDLSGGMGRFPNEQLRQRMVEFVAGL